VVLAVLADELQRAVLAGTAKLTTEQPLVDIAELADFIAACRHLVRPGGFFAAMKGLTVNMVAVDNPATPIKAMVEAKNVTIDVADVEYADAIRLCDEGLLEPIDMAKLPASPDGTSAADDFLPGAVTECAVASIVSRDSVPSRPRRSSASTTERTWTGPCVRSKPLRIMTVASETCFQKFVLRPPSLSVILSRILSEIWK
jgi:hypothetical protein